MTTRAKGVLCAIAIIITLATSATLHAEVKVPWTNGGPLLPDSSNFVTASLLVISPGEAIYSNLGHSVLRLECPIHNLDYCFSFEEEPGMGGIIKFFVGKTDAHMMAVPTAEFLSNYKREGRQVVQYELNLNTHEKQELWRLLDNDYVDEEMRHFNFLQNNCSSVSLMAIENVVVDETLDYNGWPEQYKYSNGKMVRYLSSNSPWLEFLSMTFFGTECDGFWIEEQRTGPKMLPEVLKKAVIISTEGSRRPMVVSQKEILSKIKDYPPSPITPTVVFAILLLVVVIITILQFIKRFNIIGNILDVLLMVFVTLAGIFLMYTSFVSGIFGIQFNWYLIPFNPLPLIIWLIWRKRKGFYRVYLFYTVVLVLFIIATPLSEQLDLPHQLITATLAVRCFYNYYDGKRNAATAAQSKTKKKHNKNKK